MSKRLLRLGALSATTALLAVGCSSSPPDGPLGDGGAPGLQCAYGVKGHTDTIGYPLENRSSSPVTITSITVPAARGLKMTRAFVVPIQHRPGQYQAIGELTVWPPASDPVWAHRHAIPGAAVPAGATLNLIFGLTQTTGKVGRADGPLITYSSDGNSYTIQEQTALRMGGDAACVMN
jgi:hypothetical protein